MTDLNKKDRALAISFDLDDTLWDNRPVIEQAEIAVFNWLCHHCERFSDNFTLDSLKQLQYQLVQENPQWRACVSIQRQQTIQQALRKANYRKNIDTLAAQAFDYFLQQRHQIIYWPNVEITLQQLSKKYRLFALTNGNIDIQRLTIGTYFSYSLRAEQIGISKSDPQFYYHMIQKTAIEPQNLLHIGNDPCHDVDSPRQLGIQTLWFNNGYTDWDHNLEKPAKYITGIEQIWEKIRYL